MRAAHITRFGGPEQIRYGELPDPRPGPTDVLLQVEAVAANPVDAYVRAGSYRTGAPLPFVLGRDVVGTVLEAGPGTEWATGQRVWSTSLGHQGRQGPFAEYAVAPADRVYALPDGIAPVDAVAVLQSAVTAYLGLFRHAGLAPDDTVYVGGGAGSVGSVLTRFAAGAGARVIATARQSDFAACRAAGAAEVIDYRDSAVGAQLRAAAPDGVDVHVDTSGATDLHTAVDLLAPGGRIVLIAARSATTPLPAGRLYVKDARILGFAISRAPLGDLARAARYVNTWFARGEPANDVAAVLGLDQTPRVHRVLDGAETSPWGRGRLVLRP